MFEQDITREMPTAFGGPGAEKISATMKKIQKQSVKNSFSLRMTAALGTLPLFHAGQHKLCLSPSFPFQALYRLINQRKRFINN
jgi:hypothetical protein